MAFSKKFSRKKTYGTYMTNNCSFCGSLATQKNDSGLYVCHRHLKEKLAEIKCTCGSWLEQRSGKFGPYFNCLHCGNISYAKGMEMKQLVGNYAERSEKAVEVKIERDLSSYQPVETSYSKPERSYEKKEEKKERKEITITSHDCEYFD